jgi:hypothetical protein
MNRRSAFGRPGTSGPAVVAFTGSKASAPLKLHQRKYAFLLKSKPSDDDGIAATRGLDADAFFGASPVVASALDLRLGRDPSADRPHCNTTLGWHSPKPELLTLQKSGTSHFALTGRRRA